MGAARHFKFGVLVDTEVYQCMHDRLHPKGCVQGHMTSLIIREL